MAAKDFNPSESLTTPDKADPAVNALLAAATDVSPSELFPPRFQRPQPDNFFWRGIDFVGRFAAPLGGLITLVVFLIGLVGGPAYAWVSFFYLPSLILFVIFIPAFLRRERREQEASYIQARTEQARLKAEIAQMIINQQNNSNT